MILKFEKSMERAKVRKCSCTKIHANGYKFMGFGVVVFRLKFAFASMDQDTKDANSLLVELDKGLQSPHVGDQCEAAIRFTNLIQRYPFPILVNSAFLKLAEAFRNCSNFVRIQICEVFGRNSNQLDKVHNIDDLYRSLFSVTTSNDPIARSLALLALGHIAPIVSDYKSVHHCISSSFETATESELNATITCAASYVKVSAEFACNIYPKIVSIIDSDKFSIETKIKALSVLDHGFYNANDAMVVRQFIIDVIGKTPLKKLICACLFLSTKISHNSLSHITAQIELLLKTFQNDSREVVRSKALRNLLFLADKSPHIWESTHVNPLICHLEKVVSGKQSQDDNTIGSILSIFCKLLTCNCNFILQQEKNRIFQLCYKFALSDSDLHLCSMAFELLTVKSEDHLHESTKNAMEYTSDDETAETLTAIKTFLIRTGPQKSTKSLKTDEAMQQVSSSGAKLRTIFRHIVKLCSLNPHYCSEILKLIFDRISAKSVSLNNLSHYITELMCAISQFSSNYVIKPADLQKFISTKFSSLSETNLLNLCILYFQTLHMTVDHDKTYDESLVDSLDDPELSNWFLYKIARQMMRYGHFEMASMVFQKYMRRRANTDTLHFYLKSLDQICSAESLLTNQAIESKADGQARQNLDANLETVIPMYEDSLSLLRASTSGMSKIGNFQLQYVSLRVKMLQVHYDLRHCCKLFDVLPINYATLLGAIGAARGAKSEHNPVFLSTIPQMLSVAKDFRHLANCYNNLLVKSTKGDSRTSDYIYLLKASCIIMADVIDAVFQYGKNLHVINKLSIGSTDKNLALEHRKLELTCNKLIDLIKSEIVKPGLFPSQKTAQPLIELFKGFSDELLECPFVYPRLFFQGLRATNR